MRDLLIPSFLVCDVSELLRSLTKNERCEQIAQFAQQKLATMSGSLRSLTKNELMSKLLVFFSESLIRSFFRKKRAIRSENLWANSQPWYFTVNLLGGFLQLNDSKISCQTFRRFFTLYTHEPLQMCVFSILNLLYCALPIFMSLYCLFKIKDTFGCFECMHGVDSNSKSLALLCQLQSRIFSSFSILERTYLLTYLLTYMAQTL